LAEKGVNAYAFNSHVFYKIQKLITEDKQGLLLHYQTCNVKVSVSV